MNNPEYGKKVIIENKCGKEDIAFLSNEDGHEIWVSDVTGNFIEEPKSWKEINLEEI